MPHTDDDPPLVAVSATSTVSSGTFVRALGAGLAVGALLLALRRAQVGAYTAPTAGDRSVLRQLVEDQHQT